MIINFDNSATSYPKPKQVLRAVNYAVKKCGGNAGRGGHKLSMISSEQVYSTRETIANFFDALPENVVFTQNCTQSLNTAMFGILNKGDHVVISCLEHNSVSRPIYYLSKNNYITYSIFNVGSTDDETLQNFKMALRPNTRLVITTIASNVTGQILPFRSIGEVCQQEGICYIADGSQGSGILPISLKDDSINVLCTSGHKALYGSSSSGILISDGKYSIRPLMFGGTGSTSTQLEQPNFLPDSLESGTLNVVGIVSLNAGIRFISSIGMDRIFDHEKKLCDIFINGIKDIPNVIIYRNDVSNYLPIVSFNLDGVPSSELGEYLSNNGFCLRDGFHCSALAHRFLGTQNGTVRFSPSIFNTPKEVYALVTTLKTFDYNKKK
ncbi:MAG: aminotransferase class V-fold PLP-dependent enzyme [Ruminococcus sp.]|nr:aminotransferase class V-fold PLP-dependent enzyme [Ruminococcus sp.]MCD7799958.1 aminotransferase class V-fold PLP-dependent enzyme [Ruminococcus sp.]